MSSTQNQDEEASLDIGLGLYEQILDTTFTTLERDEEFAGEILDSLRALRSSGGFLKAELVVNCLLPAELQS